MVNTTDIFTHGGLPKMSETTPNTFPCSWIGCVHDWTERWIRVLRDGGERCQVWSEWEGEGCWYVGMECSTGSPKGPIKLSTWARMRGAVATRNSSTQCFQQCTVGKIIVSVKSVVLCSFFFLFDKLPQFRPLHLRRRMTLARLTLLNWFLLTHMFKLTVLLSKHSEHNYLPKETIKIFWGNLLIGVSFYL